MIGGKEISPLDGRYKRYTKDLRAYFSEYGLQKNRVKVEIEYLISLCKVEDIPLNLSEKDKKNLREVYRNFNEEDFKIIKEIEKEGWKDYKATNHDVKAVEYFLREKIPDKFSEYIHFGLTSEDTTNLAYSFAIKESLSEVMFPALEKLGKKLIELTEKYKGQPMLAFTHGQTATPITLGKEFAVFLKRLEKQYNELKNLRQQLTGKVGGATGGLNAHRIAFPETNWPDFSKEFVESLDLELISPTTQLNPRDKLANIFNSFKQLNEIITDLNVDSWLYIHNGFLKQKKKKGEVGSSTMPHKLNPIDFENSEGNLTVANGIFNTLSSYITKSRMQRDLYDSTVKRNIGVPFAHSLIGYKKTVKGLNKIKASKKMEEVLKDTPEVLTEAIQTVLRSKDFKDAYERVKEMSRGKKITRESINSFLDKQDLDPATKERLKNLKPREYIGYSKEFAEKAVQEAKETFSS